VSDAGAREKVRLDALSAHGYAAVVSDACDRLGLRHQTMSPGISPLSGPGMLVGWARVARSESVDEPPPVPYAAEIAFLDDLKPGDLVVATAGGTPAAIWGELFSAAAMARGARGAVVDGLMRDLERVRVLGFGVHARGTRPTDSLGRVSLADTHGPAQVAGVTVANGDLVVADTDGVVVVPAEAAEEVTSYALEKATTERKGLALLRDGAMLHEVWTRYRVL
jgi:4-hydroxy-4-methyl-2-oxoglutarate aldolase